MFRGGGNILDLPLLFFPLSLLLVRLRGMGKADYAAPDQITMPKPDFGLDKGIGELCGEGTNHGLKGET